MKVHQNIVMEFDLKMPYNVRFKVHVVVYGSVIFIGNRRGENHWWHYVAKSSVINEVANLFEWDVPASRLSFVFFKRINGGETVGYHLMDTRWTGWGFRVGNRQTGLSSTFMDAMITEFEDLVEG